MKEQFLHFVWQYHRFNHRELKTTNHQIIQIVDYGQLNHHDGPDFLHAKVRIGEVLWVGNIEIHIKSSDWDLHKHSDNPLYKNVILHVVYEHDKEISNTDFPTLELRGRIPKSIYHRYLSLIESTYTLPCHHLIPDIDPYVINMYTYRLTTERLESKVGQIEQILQLHNNDFEQVAFIWLARYFGVGVNSDAFQQVATQTQHQWLIRISHEKHGTAALLLGSAGFLKNIPDQDNYIKNLIVQFEHYRNKWNIVPIEEYWWKWKIGRPASFPTLKMAQLAQLLEGENSIFNMIIDPKNLMDNVKHIVLDEFWDKHYLLNKPSVQRQKSISLNFAQRLVINVTVPMMIVYGKYIDDTTWVERALETLEQLKPEKNRITKVMSQSGLPNENALHSQALLHLKNEYCDQKKCLNCQIGNQIMRTPIHKIEEAYTPHSTHSAYI
ncbi:MAG TPA: DUF2851 family protein [Chitinophagales bacterium]|nr:DUF2851 family protein [Chitinophagales bacterium]